MEIVKEVGEQPTTPRLHRRIAAELRPILAIRGAGASLYAGTRILIRRGWILLGERLSLMERVGALAFGGYVTVYACDHAPQVAQFAVPGAVVGWCVAAWWTAPPPARTPAEQPDEEEETGPELTLDELAALVRRVAKHRQGAHLADLLQEPELVGWTQPELKATAVDFRLPVEEFKLILSGRQRVRDGIRVRDLPPEPAPEPAVEAPAAPPPGPSAEPAPQPLSTPATGPE